MNATMNATEGFERQSCECNAMPHGAAHAECRAIHREYDRGPRRVGARLLQAALVVAALVLSSSSQAAPVRLELFGSLRDVADAGLGLQDGDPFEILVEFDPVVQVGTGFPLRRVEARILDTVLQAMSVDGLIFSMTPGAQAGSLDFTLTGHPDWKIQPGEEQAVFTTLTAQAFFFDLTAQGVAGGDPDSFPLDLVFADVTNSLSAAFGLFFPPFEAGDPSASFQLELEDLSVVVVPEPGTATLLGLGLYGLALAGRMRGGRRTAP